MRQAKLEGRPVTDTVIMVDGRQIDLGPIFLKMERRRQEPEPEVPKEEKPNLEEMRLRFERAKQQRRENGCEDEQLDKREALVLYHETTRQQGKQVIAVPPEKRRFEQGKCIKGAPLHPYCICSSLTTTFAETTKQLMLNSTMRAVGDRYFPIWLEYRRQISQTHCFDIDVYPGLSLGASVSGYDFKKDHDLMMELANRAIEEYNERECNVFKYKVIKIEKVNLAVTDFFDYWMTVRVLNLTLATPIETFQIHAGKKCLDDDVKFICCCQPKEEPVVGLANCDFCLRKKLPL
ncbi:hypothetical protein P3S68_020239 [Capsicum galapagoense]